VTDRHGVKEPRHNLLDSFHLVEGDVMDQSLLSHLLKTLWIVRRPSSLGASLESHGWKGVEKDAICLK
jgi:hypothetical protein